ncbi:hypothetical protein EDB89DRAFT_1913779 [Lactarius sanguifluus]|nr:hypothetical protein EDB89DRAFT_1913779 [Lactarius sanguifluus]
MLTTPTTSAANGRPTHSQPLSTVLPSTAPPDHRLNWEDYTYPTELLQRPRNAPDPEAAPSPQRIPVFEYQWRDELVSHLSKLPPRSNFGGKFAIIADPDVDNGMRAQIFADQLRAQGVPISCEDGCQGRFLVSVGDDTSHPYDFIRYHVLPPPFLASDPLVSYQGNVSSHLLELESTARRYHGEKRLSRQEAEECSPRT